MRQWKSVVVASCGLLALNASVGSAVVVEESVTPAYVQQHPKDFNVKIDRGDDGLIHFTIRRNFAGPTYVVASVAVRDGEAAVFESHFPAFVREKSATYRFSLPVKFVADSTFELSERSFTKVGDESVPMPGGTDYRFRLADFADEGNARNDQISKSRAPPDSVRTKLEALFGKHYPEATTTVAHGDRLRFEFETTTYEFPYNGKIRKRESTTQRGPKKGGILCNIYLSKGPYRGQLALPATDDKDYVPQQTLDRKEYKVLVMAPYSEKRDAHLWVALEYPPDASEDFLTQFRQIMADFQQDVD